MHSTPWLLRLLHPVTNEIVKITNLPVVFTVPGPGDYYIEIIQAQEDPDFLSPFSLIVTTFCDALCVNPNNPARPPNCGACGDGILDKGEDCDNGNKAGCSNCLITKGYSCFGNLGGSSIC